MACTLDWQLFAQISLIVPGKELHNKGQSREAHHALHPCIS